MRVPLEVSLAELTVGGLGVLGRETLDACACPWMVIRVVADFGWDSLSVEVEEEAVSVAGAAALTLEVTDVTF